MKVIIKHKPTLETFTFSEVSELRQYCFENPILCDIKMCSGISHSFNKKDFSIVEVKYE